VIKLLLPTEAKGIEAELFNFPTMNRKFLRNQKPQCHEVRYLFNDEDHITGVHVDTQNGRYNPDEPKTRMNAIVGCFSKSIGNKRYAMVGYGRESIYDASLRYQKFSPCIKEILKFYEKCEINTRDISTDMVSMLMKQADENDGVARINVHLNKFVYYSPVIDTIYFLSQKYHLDVYQKMALVYASILSESNDIFMKVAHKTTEQFWNNTDFCDIAYQLYKEIWNIKNTTTETPGQRHAPTVTREGTKEQVYRSMKLIAAIHHSLLDLSEEECNELHFFVKVLAIFSSSTNGVHHAGDLLGQHLIMIGSAVGIFPLEFATFGEIGDTKA